MNILETSMECFMLIWIIVEVFLLCESGAIVTSQFELFDNELSQCDWHLLPIQMQRTYLIFKSDSQHSIQISAYGQIVCERDTAKKVSAVANDLYFRRIVQS